MYREFEASNNIAYFLRNKKIFEACSSKKEFRKIVSDFYAPQRLRKILKREVLNGKIFRN